MGEVKGLRVPTWVSVSAIVSSGILSGLAVLKCSLCLRDVLSCLLMPGRKRVGHILIRPMIFPRI